MFVLTHKGKQRLIERLEQLEERLKAVLAQKGEAAEVGGNVWHDNFAFEQLQREEAMLQHQIQQLRRTIEMGRVVPQPSSCEKVQVGCRVLVAYEDGVQDCLTIGGHMESDPPRKIISYDAPLAQSIMGASIGEARSFNVGSKKREVTVIKIEIAAGS